MFKALIIFGGGFFVSLIFYHLRRYLKKHERIIDWDIKNIFDWLLQKTKNQTNNTKKLEVSQTEEEKHYEWYIEEQMKNYVDDETILRWEGEEVKVKDLKERSNGTSN